MIKKLLFILVLFNAYALHAMTTAHPYGKEEADFIAAIAKGDIAAVNAHLAKRPNVNQKFVLGGFENTSPLEVALRDTIAVFDYSSGQPRLKAVVPNSAQRYAIADLFLAKGANKESLEKVLPLAVGSGDAKTALWILSKGAVDKTSNLVRIARDNAQKARTAEDKALWTQIQNRLQENIDKQLKEKLTAAAQAKNKK